MSISRVRDIMSHITSPTSEHRSWDHITSLGITSQHFHHTGSHVTTFSHHNTVNIIDIGETLWCLLGIIYNGYFCCCIHPICWLYPQHQFLFIAVNWLLVSSIDCLCSCVISWIVNPCIILCLWVIIKH